MEALINSADVEVGPLRGDERVVIGVLLCDRPVLQRWLDALNALRCSLPFGVVLARGPGLHKLNEICAGRAAIVNRALKIKARYVFFLDDDVLVPPDGLDKLLDALCKNARARVIGGLYPQLGFNNQSMPAAWDELNYALTSVPMDTVVRCAGVGSGCMLLDLSVFRELAQPWFSFSARAGSSDSLKGDDVLLCAKIRTAGYEVLLHGGVVCSHLDARIAGSDFRGKSPWELSYRDGRYFDAAGNFILRSQVEH